ncbi:hypothetical protein AA0473_1922 [Acetobacter orleanensis NRIC 0473]|nr:hypothetical protein Abol_048_026 [Acetobacter orleanensis JCM 7639]GBR29055.1 hypothetical protein AA0473_1922 [Acetobacter orleanensis NRIC 0473]
MLIMERTHLLADLLPKGGGKAFAVDEGRLMVRRKGGRRAHRHCCGQSGKIRLKDVSAIRKKTQADNGEACKQAK